MPCDQLDDDTKGPLAPVPRVTLDNDHLAH